MAHGAAKRTPFVPLGLMLAALAAGCDGRAEFEGGGGGAGRFWGMEGRGAVADQLCLAAPTVAALSGLLTVGGSAGRPAILEGGCLIRACLRLPHQLWPENVELIFRISRVDFA
jgi:hypothetical protein